MLMKISILISILSLAVTTCFGQLERANQYFLQENYIEAIKNYEKVLKKDDTNIQANQNIAFSYRKLKDYANAEIYYQKAIEVNPNEPSNYLYYGQVLKNNNKLNEARQQFNKLIEKQPNSLLGKMLVQSIDDIYTWEKEDKNFEIKLVENINSEYADFCALAFKDAVIFVSERRVDYVNEKTDSYTNRPYLSIFYSKKDDNFEKVKEFSSQLNTEYHDGPVSISSDGNTIYFTRSIKGELSKKSINHSKIYQATAKGNKWTNITNFPFNSDSYSVAHPFISADEKTLFFTSNMPGGKGGMDLYKVTKTDTSWSEPINLGQKINTSSDELFPYLKDEILYFSSDGHGGYGGLDLYAISMKDNLLGLVENLKAPINSSADDFGITFQDKDTGYFSSNRTGGVGSDDIYSFKWNNIEEKTALTGVLKYNKLSSDGAKLQLVDENDQVIQTTTTNKDGVFRFDKLKMDENYLIKINEEDENLLNQSKIYITNSKGERVILATRLGAGKFKFKALKYSYYEELKPIDEVDESLLSINIFGQVYKKLPGDYGNEMKIFVVDENGNIIGTAKTDKNGKFVFEKLSPDEAYLFKLEEDDEGYNIIILDENGKIIDNAKKIARNRYNYKRLSSDKTIITLINEEDEVIKIAENENFIISKILYDYDSFEINAASKKELDKLITLLQKNKEIGVELSSHTDDIGSANFNLNLSQKRADAAVEYIISKGIAKEKIIAKGYGKAHPIAPNKFPNGKDNPEGRAKNRRTEFKVVKAKN